jgi:hypothetical protein
VTLYIGDKLVKCDAAGVPVTGESGVLFEVESVSQGTEYVGASLKRLADPDPQQPAADDTPPPA